MKVSWLLRAQKRQARWSVSVFCGPHPDRRELTGTLMLFPAEWEELKLIMPDAEISERNLVDDGSREARARARAVDEGDGSVGL